MTDAIRVRPGQLSAVLDFRATSALGGCTTIDSDEQGIFIARNWPSLSTGEEILWRVLGWMNGQADLPSDSDLEAELDAGNQRAVQNARAAA
ncbi:hypothetical protein [Nocardioides kribbensis]|uniref:Uncharacterized protein n=1 Tax=Nocardioides kribbensis TaxID=305517 RepID=A0ABV1NZ65_9ACTN|nr:hypothetical protein [Nocardioides kribbensis]